MCIRIITLSISLSIIILLAACQQDVKVKPEQGRTFIKLYGGFNTEKAYAAEQTSEGSYVCFGSTNSYGFGGLDMYLIKTDAGGNKEWEKTLGGSSQDEGKALQILPDGSFLCLGDYTHEDGFTDLYLVKLTNTGEVVWSKTFGHQGRSEKAFDLKVTLTGDFLLIGNSQQTTGPTDMYLVRTDAEGNMRWEKNYGLTGLQDDISSVKETAEGNLVWCGSEYRQRNESIPPDIRIILTSQQGDILWDKNFGKENTDNGSDILLTDQGYIAVGHTYNSQSAESDIYLISLLKDGSLRWEQVLQKTRSSEEASSIALTNDGGYIITGSITLAGNQDIYLLKTDKRGNELWSKNFGGQYADTGTKVKQTRDGGYMVFGTIYFETNPMLCLIKTDATGELNSK
jgi:hypothetical protein